MSISSQRSSCVLCEKRDEERKKDKKKKTKKHLKTLLQLLGNYAVISAARSTPGGKLQLFSVLFGSYHFLLKKKKKRKVEKKKKINFGKRKLPESRARM